MKKYLSRRRSPTLNITPLIDILFVVVIFFSVGTELTNNSGIPLVLPDSDSAERSAEKPGLKITIDANNIIYVHHRAIPFKSFQDAISNGNYNSDSVTELEIDTAVPHGFIIKILDVLRKNRFTQINFSTREKQ